MVIVKVVREKVGKITFQEMEFVDLCEYYATALQAINEKAQSYLNELDNKEYIVASNIKVAEIYPFDVKAQSEIELFSSSNYLCEICESMNGNFIVERHFLSN